MNNEDDCNRYITHATAYAKPMIAALIIGISVISCAHPDKTRFSALCETTFEYIYDLHIKAINNAHATRLMNDHA